MVPRRIRRYSKPVFVRWWRQPTFPLSNCTFCSICSRGWVRCANVKYSFKYNAFAVSARCSSGEVVRRARTKRHPVERITASEKNARIERRTKTRQNCSVARGDSISKMFTKKNAALLLVLTLLSACFVTGAKRKKSKDKKVNMMLREKETNALDFIRFVRRRHRSVGRPPTYFLARFPRQRSG